jgi:calcineurin-like phosphoesterase family protein
MKTWIITDTHFNHRKMEEYCGRPANFESRILKGLKQIQPDDVVIHLGDFCIGDDVKWHEFWNSALFANKRILVRGNHDRKSNAWYYAHGWHTVCESLSIHYNNKYITFSHIPIQGIQNINIHGHFHNNLHRLLRGEYVVEGEKERNDKDFPLELYDKNIYKLLAIEDTNYKPVLLDNLINNYPPEITLTSNK